MQLRSGKCISKEELDSEEDSVRRSEIVHAADCPNRKTLTKVTNQSKTKCNNFSSPQGHQHWLKSRSKNDSGFASSSKSTSEKKKKKDRLRFFPTEEGWRKPSSFPEFEENQEESLRRVSVYSRHLKGKPPLLELSDDERDIVCVESPSALSEPYGTKPQGAPPQKVEKSISSSTLRRAYWTHPELRGQFGHKGQPTKSVGKGRIVTGINKSPLSFIAAKLSRSPAGPFYTDGAEFRHLQAELQKNVDDLPCIVDNEESSRTLNYSKEDVKRSFPLRTESIKVKTNNNNTLEVIGQFYEILLEGKVLWKGSNEE